MPAEATPLHRSPVALRVEGAGAVLADELAALLVALLFCVAFAGATELLKTAWPD